MKFHQRPSRYTHLYYKPGAKCCTINIFGDNKTTKVSRNLLSNSGSAVIIWLIIEILEC